MTTIPTLLILAFLGAAGFFVAVCAQDTVPVDQHDPPAPLPPARPVEALFTGAAAPVGRARVPGRTVDPHTGQLDPRTDDDALYRPAFAAQVGIPPAPAGRHRADDPHHPTEDDR